MSDLSDLCISVSLYLVNTNIPEPDPLPPSLSYFRFCHLNLGSVDTGLTNEDRDEEGHSVTQPFLRSSPPSSSFWGCWTCRYNCMLSLYQLENRYQLGAIIMVTEKIRIFESKNCSWGLQSTLLFLWIKSLFDVHNEWRAKKAINKRFFRSSITAEPVQRKCQIMKVNKINLNAILQFKIRHFSLSFNLLDLI